METRKYTLDHRLNDAFDVSVGWLVKLHGVALEDELGVVGPVHVDRGAYSLMAVLGEQDKFLLVRLHSRFAGRVLLVEGEWND